MRLSILVLLASTVVLGVLSTARAEAQGPQVDVVHAQDQPSGKLDIDINLNDGGGGGGSWYANPMWVAIGGLAVVLLLALVVMAGRSGGTTVLK
jgi:hypothetical protein